MDNTVYSNPNDIINGFTEIFNSVYLAESTSETQPFIPQHFHPGNIPNIWLEKNSEYDILRVASKLKDKMTAGPDGIPSFLLIASMFSLCHKWPFTILPLGKISSLIDGKKPKWYHKLSSDIIISNFSKLFEIIIYNKIYHRVINQISLNLHVFINRRSTMTNLAVFSR